MAKNDDINKCLNNDFDAVVLMPGGDLLSMNLDEMWQTEEFYSNSANRVDGVIESDRIIRNKRFYKKVVDMLKNNFKSDMSNSNSKEPKPEPVVYYKRTNFGGVLLYTAEKGKPEDAEPLYTKEQLQPKVKMTPKQKELMLTYKKYQSMFTQFIELTKANGEYKKFGIISEEELMIAWLNPEENIEIIPDKKWFVSSTTRGTLKRDDYFYLQENSVRQAGFFPEYKKGKQNAAKFDTKEEAEEWVTPSTEAVLLEVESE